MKRLRLHARTGVSRCLFLSGIVALAASTDLHAQTGDVNALPQLTPSVTMRVGSLDDPVLGFSNIGAVTVGPDDRIYVVERQDREIRVLHADGTPLRTIGGPGEGPGEFASRPGELGFIGDTLWVHDPRRRRVHLFSTSGDVVGDFSSTGATVDVGGRNILMVDLMIGADGRLLLTPRQGTVLPSSGAGFPDSVSVPVLRLDRDGESRDTVQEVSVYVGFESPPGGVPQADLILDPWPYATGPMRRWTRDGSIVVEQPLHPSRGSESFIVSRVTLAGAGIYRHEFSYTPEPVDRETAEAWIDIPDGLDIPDLGPAVTDAVAGDDGSVWLRRNLGGSDEQTWLLLDPTGAPQGQVTLPQTYRLRWVRGNEALAVELDEFEVPWLVRLEVG